MNSLIYALKICEFFPKLLKVYILGLIRHLHGSLIKYTYRNYIKNFF